MPTTSSNITLYATYQASYDSVVIASATALNTYTLVATAPATGCLVTDLLFRSADASARNFNIVLAPTGSQATAQYSMVQVSIPANSGNNGSTAIASLAALAPSIFDIDLAGNRVLSLESGTSIYVQNTAATTGAITVTAKRRNY